MRVMKSTSTARAAGFDPTAAQAIDRVLEAEREAQAAVAACEQEGTKVLEAAREQARGIIERAQARTVALHGRAAKKLELCAAAFMEERMKTAAEAVKQLSDPGRLGVALERVVTQLTTETASRDVA
jgi:regulator of protease activity HflC (stomatin/prohibitin superfamily)